jgi:hypothetical protein
MSGYQRQSAIALDRYDPEDRAPRELVFEVQRRMRLRGRPWRRFRRRAWEASVASRIQSELSESGNDPILIRPTRMPNVTGFIF